MKHKSKCLDKCSMRRDRNPLEQLSSHMLAVRSKIVHNVLKDEEDQSEDHSYFSLSEEDLNEEGLKDEDNVEHDKHDEGNIVRNILKCKQNKNTSKAMSDNVYDEVSDEPCQIVQAKLHPHD